MSKIDHMAIQNSCKVCAKFIRIGTLLSLTVVRTCRSEITKFESWFVAVCVSVKVSRYL
jgi:hypothetical protein